MRRWLSIAAFGLILLSLPAWGQRQGGGARGSSGGFYGHSSGAVHSSGSFHSQGFSHSSGMHGYGVQGSGIHLQSGNPYYHHRGYGHRSYYYYPYASYYPYGYYPYAGYYGWSPDSLTSQSDYQDDGRSEDVYADANYSGPYREDSGVQRDVQALSGKIDRLQADVEARNSPKPEMEPATALVFRDQHVEEVRNYAISGGVLWVLNQQTAKKIPLAELDLEATAKMNDDRGVDFQVPEPTLSIMIVR